MEECMDKIDELNNQIWDLEDKLSELKSERDKVCAGGLNNLVDKYFKNSHYNVFEIIKVRNICKFDEIFTIKAIYLKYYISDFKSDEYFVYYGSYDIPLNSNVKDSMNEFYDNYDEISEEEFNSLLKEAFNNYSNNVANEII